MIGSREETERYFSNLAESHTTTAGKLNRRYNQLSAFRAIFFVAFVVWAIYLVDEGMPIVLLISVVLYFLAFSALINYHHKVRFRRDHEEALAHICREEIQRLHLNLDGLDEGSDYMDQQHAYAYDLDIFGRRSVYQWLNRTVTKMGSDKLAGALSQPSDAKTVAERQEAVKELESRAEWRLNFGAFGWPYRHEIQNTAPFLAWMKEEDEPFPGWLIAVSYILPVVTVSAIVGYFMGVVPYYVPLLLTFAAGSVVKRNLQEVIQTEEYTVSSLKAMSGYEKLIGQILKEDYESKLATEAVRNLKAGEGAPSAIRQLKRLFDFMESRRNFFYQLLNVVFLIEVHLLVAFRKWKLRHKDHIEGWLDAIGTFDFINSLAATAYAQKELTFPAVGAPGYHIEGSQLGHPLISPENRVSNDFSFDGQGSVLLVTGSNMSGKSTFLRTVGINMVLALAGAPVCATNFSTGEVQVFTSMRTQDNLEESVSGFYAELKRLRQLLDLLEQTDKPVLFLLDEILKGTNSDDRHKGSEGLIRQLSRLNGFGMVSTHDLTLGHLEESMDKLKNVSFNSRIENGTLVFDYTLTPGVCRSFNASKLMMDLGIEVA
ncbi:MAG: DNA mismatch repair protein MutS [Cyclobacteriaceae bacterium]